MPEHDLKAVWKNIIAELQIQNVVANIKVLLSKVHLENYTGGQIDIVCESSFTSSLLQRKLLDNLKILFIKLLQAPEDIKVNFVIRAETPDPSNVPALGPLFDADTTSKKSLKEDVLSRQLKSGLSPKYLFENYLMGKHNQLAYAVATAVAQEPGTKYNPVFIYSGVGLGKTHLMQAIGNQILKDKPNFKILYCTGEAFTNEVIETIQKGKGNGNKNMPDLRNKYRNTDVLLIDDIQFIIGKERTQAEFFHTFNDLCMMQKQVILTSDRPPKEFKTLEERVTSRFASGMIVDIQKPDLETRSAILRSRRERDGDDISNEVIDFIAEKIDSNVRELEGAYIQVIASAASDAQKGLSAMESAAKVLGQNIKESSKKPVNINQIVKAVCDYYSVKKDDLRGKSRNREYVVPRQIAMYLIKDMMDMPFMTIGEFLGGRDHTTIMHGCEKVEKEMLFEPKYKQDIANLKQTIHAH